MSGSSTPTSIPGLSLPNVNLNGMPAPTGVRLDNWQNPTEFFNNLTGGPPKTQDPTALSTTPTVEQTNTTSVQRQLASQSAARAYGSGLTGGAGLLDQASTTSQILLGS